ncbi:MAG: hypothetical protein Fur0046_13730 [Cyanobacteria bacterium J069]
MLATYRISQNRLVVAMGLGRSTINHWVNEISDPLADAIPDVVAALETVTPAAAREFLVLYLGHIPGDDATP